MLASVLLVVALAGVPAVLFAPNGSRGALGPAPSAPMGGATGLGRTLIPDPIPLPRGPCSTADALPTSGIESHSGRLTLPAGECTYVYLGLTAGRGFLGSNFSIDDQLANRAGGTAALVGRSFSDNGSVSGPSGLSSVLEGIGVNTPLTLTGHWATNSTSPNLTVSFRQTTFVLLVVAERNVSFLSGISPPFQQATPWSGPVVGGSVLGGFATAEFPTGAYAISATFGGANGPAAGIMDVYTSSMAAMDWEAVPMHVANGTPSGWGGEGSRLAVDGPLGQAVLFGGGGPRGLSGSTLVLNVSTGSWVTLPTGALSPTPRANFTFLSYPTLGFAVLFGGVVNLVTNACDNQTWLFYFGQDRWQNVSRSPAPPPREGAASAIDVNDSLLLLEGGSDPGYPVTGGVASVLWNDTWLMNLTSFLWRQVSAGRGPPPRTDAVMTFVPPLRTFLLMGGCARLCSATGWEMPYSPSPAGDIWSPWGPQGGPVVPGLGGSAWVWDPTDQAALLFGGYREFSSVLVPLNESLAWYPSNSTWTYVAAPDAAPSARFGSAADYFGSGPCPAMLVLGGSPVASGAAPDLFALDSNRLPETAGPALGPLCGVEPKPSIPPPSLYGNLSVDIRGLAGGPLPGAVVWVSGAIGLEAQTRSDGSGWANFTHLPEGAVLVNGSLVGYANNTTRATIVGGTTVVANLTLVRMGTLVVDVRGDSYLDLVQYPVPGAFVQVAPLGARSSLVSTFTNLTGAAQLILPAGWYTLFVEAYGFASNVPLPPSNIRQIVWVPEVVVQTVHVVLAPLPGPDVTVTVLDAHTLRTIPAANLTLSLSVPDGPLYFLGLWRAGANGSFIWFAVSPAVYSIEASARGYVTNATSASLHVNSPPVFLDIYLTPASELVVPCGSLIAPCTGGGTPGGGIDAPFGSRLIVGSPEFWSFVLVPLLVLGLIVAEIAWLRRRRDTVGEAGSAGRRGPDRPRHT
jgi:Galactose oxidase, central domain